MNNNKYYIYKTDKFSIKIPHNWKIEITDFVCSFYNPKGVGVIQISTYTTNDKSKKINTKEKLKEMARVPNIIMKTNKNSIQTNFKRDSKYWKMKIVKSGNSIGFITYNCEEKDKNQGELDIVNSMFDSLKLL